MDLWFDASANFSLKIVFFPSFLGLRERKKGLTQVSVGAPGWLTTGVFSGELARSLRQAITGTL